MNSTAASGLSRSRCALSTRKILDDVGGAVDVRERVGLDARTDLAGFGAGLLCFRGLRALFIKALAESGRIRSVHA